MKVRVWNDNVIGNKKYPYQEKWRGKEVIIPGGEFIEMEVDEAHLFLNSFSPILVGKDGEKRPEGFKRLRIEKITDAAPVKEQFVCNRCSYEAPTKVALDDHIDARHLDDIVDQEVAKKRRGRKPQAKEQVA